MTSQRHHAHFIGIGGIGMSGLAELLHRRGDRVTGSDLGSGTNVARLRELGIEIFLGHDAAQLDAANVVIYSSAIPAENPELAAARKRGFRVLRRAELLAELMAGEPCIAIAGTHGKTTTTALVAHLLAAGGIDPIALIGGRVPGPDGGRSPLRSGEGSWWVAEADESDGSFLLFEPRIAVVTNVDPDHLDHYGSIEALRDAFETFCKRLPVDGLAIVCGDHPGSRELQSTPGGRSLRYGLGEDVDLRADQIVASGREMHFSVSLHGERLGEVTLPLPGRHNVSNALAALAVALEVGVPFATAAAAVASFPGVGRRFERKGQRAGIEVVDDYAHHPAEVRATLAAARDAHAGRIVSIFQPHRYSRTRDCFDDFASAFVDCDVLVVCGTYAAGEKPIPGAGAEQLVDAIRKTGHPDARFLRDFDEILQDLPGELRSGDLILTLGAGNVVDLGPRLLEGIAREGSA